MLSRERARRLVLVVVALAALAVLAEFTPMRLGAPVLAIVGAGTALAYCDDAHMPALAWNVWLVYAARRASARPLIGPPESMLMVFCISTVAIVAVAVAGRSEQPLAVVAAIAAADIAGWLCSTPETNTVTLARIAAYFPIVLATAVLFANHGALHRLTAVGVYIYLAYAPAVPLAIGVGMLAFAAIIHVHAHGVDHILGTTSVP